ncbi:hypothetical protein JS528_04915 [Bifidobacterium sp. MA2]|uniref:Uncharacterized protein n=1 Tax=Bifidobacterium santillanense TaxID=2809028 RepID=A0ABS5UP59_9BIFI|nr:hypothetical protein [Bifidobacterium santillanense]MBT1172702.1 hypothetical protein [Bifidobacterium santillanense]
MTDVAALRANVLRRVWWLLQAVICTWLSWQAVLIRWNLGHNLPLDGYRSTRNLFDDWLLIQYAQLERHFHPVTAWDKAFALAKTMSFPYFLNAIRDQGIPYRTAFTGLYVIGAFVATFGLWRLWRRLTRIPSRKADARGVRGWRPPVWFWHLAFLFLLFSPTAFEDVSGIRIYREALLPPIVMLLAGLAMAFAAGFLPRARSPFDRRWWVLSWRFGQWVARWALQVALGLALGAVWAFFWFIKESSIWLAPMAGAALLVSVVGILCTAFVRDGRHIVVRLVAVIAALAIVATPLVVFDKSDKAYRQVNVDNYGVSIASSRTEGEIAGFFQRLYNIRSKDRTIKQWAPSSVIERVYEISPTLQSKPALLWYMYEEGFLGSGSWDGTATKDMGVWAVHWDIASLRLFRNQKETQRFFHKVNQEIDAAHLPQQTKGFSPSASLGPLTLDQIWSMSPSFQTSANSVLYWDGYTINKPSKYVCSTDPGDDASLTRRKLAKRCATVDKTIGEKLPTSVKDPTVKRQRPYVAQARRIIEGYQAYAPTLVNLGIAALVASLLLMLAWPLRRVSRDWNRRGMALWGLFLSFGVCAVALILATAWITYPTSDDLMHLHSKLYTVGITPLVQILEIAACLFLLQSVVETAKLVWRSYLKWLTVSMAESPVLCRPVEIEWPAVEPETPDSPAHPHGPRKVSKNKARKNHHHHPKR